MALKTGGGTTVIAGDEGAHSGYGEQLSGRAAAAGAGGAAGSGATTFSTVHPVIKLIPGYAFLIQALPLFAYSCADTPALLLGVGLKMAFAVAKLSVSSV